MKDETKTYKTYTYEHKGYVLQQTSYNWHYMIFKDDKMVMHCQCTKKLTEEEAKEHIDFYIKLRDGMDMENIEE